MGRTSISDEREQTDCEQARGEKTVDARADLSSTMNQIKASPPNPVILAARMAP